MTEFDIILRGGTVIDGSGQPRTRADVGINGERIAKIGDLSQGHATTEVDVSGLIVAPGFINMLSWSISSLIRDGRAVGGITQGVTLEIMGEGWSMGPLNQTLKDYYQEHFDFDLGEIPWTTLSEYLSFLEGHGISPNVASFVGATTLRSYVIGEENRQATAEELGQMQDLVRQAMEVGALGVGSSLIYPPAFFASTEELVAMCKAAAEYGGRYISHIRNEGNQIEEAIDELITIAREAGIGAEIYHLKQAGKQNWPKLDRVLRKIEDARAGGLDITTDMYLYTAAGTGLDSTLPPWIQDGGEVAMYHRLKDPEQRKKMIEAMNTDSNDWENLFFAAGPSNILISSIKKPEMAHFIGKTIAEIAEEQNTSAEDTIIDLLLAAEGRIGAIYFMMNEDNLRRQIQLPYMSFGSDASSQVPEGYFLKFSPHPRAYGNVPRLLGKYVREEQLITLEEAIHRLTEFPANNLGISERGLLKDGYFADLAIFDAEKIIDKATYKEPHQLSEGMVHVFVNGQQVLKDGIHTGALPGQWVRGPGSSS